MKWIIILLLIFILWRLYLWFKKWYLNKKAIGKRFSIHYFDQNINFENIFPLNGIITEKIKIGKGLFFVMKLDNSFAYDFGNCDTICIRERHLGFYIGSKKPVHVHVLLPKIDLNLKKYKFKQFDHVVWAEIKPI